MNQSSLVRARPSDLPCFALAQDQLQPRIFDHQQVLGRPFQSTTLSSRLLLGTFAGVSFVAFHAAAASIALHASGAFVAPIALHAATHAASHRRTREKTLLAKFRSW